eukprot:scaffold1766_cov401-Prasinococcus_capsulatus_cf.AAC.31
MQSLARRAVRVVAGTVQQHRRGLKATTGIVGLPVEPEGRTVLIDACRKVLRTLKASNIPEDDSYYQDVWTIYHQRLEVALNEETIEVRLTELLVQSSWVQDGDRLARFSLEACVVTTSGTGLGAGHRERSIECGQHTD